MMQEWPTYRALYMKIIVLLLFSLETIFWGEGGRGQVYYHMEHYCFSCCLVLSYKPATRIFPWSYRPAASFNRFVITFDVVDVLYHCFAGYLVHQVLIICCYAVCVVVVFFFFFFFFIVAVFLVFGTLHLFTFNKEKNDNMYLNILCGLCVVYLAVNSIFVKLLVADLVSMCQFFASLFGRLTILWCLRRERTRRKTNNN